MSDKKEAVARLRGKRRGNRSVITKLVNEVEIILQAEAIDQRRLKVIACLLNKKLRSVESLDEGIISLCLVEEIDSEIEEYHDVNSRAMEI